MNQLALSFAPAPRRITLKPQAVRVLVALRRCGGEATPWECCRHLGPLTQRNVVSSRFSELAELGYVTPVGARRGPLGKPETVFALTDSGSRVAIEAETTP